MDVKVAVISGVAFAGVLVAGAIAAPRGGSDDTTTTGEPSGVITTDAVGNFVFQPATSQFADDDERYEDDDDDDDDRYEHDDDDDDDDDHERREHDDDDDHEDDD